MPSAHNGSVPGSSPGGNTNIMEYKMAWAHKNRPRKGRRKIGSKKRKARNNRKK